MKRTWICCLLLTISGLCNQVLGQCESDRYKDSVFIAERTVENSVYNQSWALQGACAIETNTSFDDYALDVYEPIGDTISKRPVLVYAHGGGFLIGDKRIIPVDQYCYKMAERGFVVVSIDYRKCFNTVSTPSIERAVYRAVQDFNAAVRWVKAKADTFRIDTNMVFAGGNSAGSIMAIFSTYGDDYERAAIPSTYNAPDLGCMDCSGNYFNGRSKAKAVLNFWGATLDTNIIEAGDPPMLSMHGNADNAVPFSTGIPFSYPAFPPVLGSEPISQRLNHLGIVNELYVFDGMGHEPWLVDSDQLDTIVEYSSSFLHRLFLKPQTPQIVGPTDVCMGDTLTYGLLNSSDSSNYCWSVENAQLLWSSANGDEIQLVVNQLGSASLSVTELNKYEAESDTGFTQINVYEYPTIQVSADTVICEGTTIQLAASGGVTYNWLPDTSLLNSTAASPFASPTLNTNYSVEVSNGFCSLTDSIQVAVLPKPFISAGNDVTICKGDTGTLDAWPQGNVFYWTPSSNLEHPNFLHTRAWPSVTTNYTFTTIDTNGCENSDEAIVYVRDLPEPPPIFQTQDGLTTIFGYSYQWLFEGQNIAGATNVDLTITQDGNYSVEVTDSNGCSSISDIFYYSVGIAEESIRPVEIYPNPSDGLFAVGGVVFESAEIKVFDFLGKLVYSAQMTQSQRRLNLKHLEAGAYLLEIQTMDKIYSGKILLY